MKKILLFWVIFIFLAGVGWGQQAKFTWTGGGSDTDWNNPANWDVIDTNGILTSDDYPGSESSRVDDIVIIDNGDNVTLNVSVNAIGSLNIDNSNLDLNIFLLTVDTLSLTNGAELKGVLTANNVTIDGSSTLVDNIDFSGGGNLEIILGIVTITGDDIVCGDLDFDTRDVKIEQNEGSPGNVQLSSVITAGDISIYVEGALTQSGGGITGDKLILTGGGDFSLDNAGNKVNSIQAVDNSGTHPAAIQFTNNADLIIDGIKADVVTVTVTAGNIIFKTDIITAGNQTYTGTIKLGEDVNLEGVIVTLGSIDGNGKSLTITGEGFLQGGNNIDDLSVHGDLNLVNGSLSAATVNVSGTSNLNGNVNTTGNQTYTGAVTLGGTGIRTLTSTGGNVTVTGTVTGAAGITINAYHGISLANAANALSGNITLDNTQPGTPIGDITFYDSSAAISLSAENNTTNGKIIINKTGNLSIDLLKTSTTGGINVTATGAVTQTGAIETGALTVNAGTGITLNNTANKVTSVVFSDTTGNIDFTNDYGSAGNLNVTADADNGNVIITEKTGGLYINDISSGIDINLDAKTDIETKEITVSGIVSLNAGGKITLNGNITANQLLVTTAGNVSVGAFKIETKSTGNENTNAAIYISANDFDVSLMATNTIIPGGMPLTGQWGQLCLALNTKWNNTYHVVVDGSEDIDPYDLHESGYRWHQHFVDLAGNHLIYGTVPQSLEPLPPSGYVIVRADNVKTTFILSNDCNVYINDAVNTNTSGITFKTSGTGEITFSGTNKFEKIILESGGTGYIEFSGKNEFENITLKSGSGNNEGIWLVDTEIIVKGNFELNNNEKTKLDTIIGSSIEADNITLNDITAEDEEKLTLKANSTTGIINLKGTVGTSTAPVGDITVVNANTVTFSNNIYANNIYVTSTNTIISANITAVTAASTAGVHIYSGAVTLGGIGTTRILTGSTVTLETITGGGNSLTIYGNGILNGGSGINILSISGTTAINQDINTNGTQIYTGAVTLGGSGIRTLTGSTVTLGHITGPGEGLSLDIIGKGVLNGAGGIGDLSVSDTVTINADVTTIRTQNYTGAVTLGNDIELTGTIINLGTITGGGKSLKITGNGLFSGGNGIGNLTVTEDFGLASSTLDAAKVDVAGKSSIAADISTIGGTQTYTGTVTLGGIGTTRILTGSTVTLGNIIGGGNSLTITGNGVLNGGSGINELEITGTAAVNGDITTTGNQKYTGAVKLNGSGSVSGIRTITSSNGDILFSNTLDVVDKTQHKIELLARGGEITVSGQIEAYQLIAKAKGTVSVNKIDIDESNNGNDGLNAAIYIEAHKFDVTTTDVDSIVPGGKTGAQWGQLCLVLYENWIDSDDVVDGDEDDADNPGLVPNARWHQHVIDIAGKHLVYGDGTEPAGIPGPYVKVSNNNLRTIFILEHGFNVYIYNALITPNNFSGLSFTTDGGFIEFHGINEINNITLDSNIGIYLVDTKIEINEGFDLNHNEEIILKTNSPSGTGENSIKAANITLNNIDAVNNEKLTLETTSGEINLNGTVGSSGNYIGDITIKSADKVKLSRDLFANRINLTSTGATIGADITATGTQTYSGAVTLDGGNRILKGTTVTLGIISGNSHSLTINGNGILNGGYDINILTITEDFNLAGGLLEAVSINVTNTGKKSIIAGNITTGGTQTYSGQVELGGTGTKTLEGTTITLGTVTGNGNSLTINGSSIINGGSGINELIVSGIAIINADINITGKQTYTGAVTLNGSERIISSQNAGIEFMNTLDSTGKIELSAARGNITVSGKSTAYQLIAKAPSGSVSVNAIEIDPTNIGNEGENAAIYIIAENFIVTTAPSPPYIIPGGPGGQLCLELKNKWEDTNSVIDGCEEGDPFNTGLVVRWHQHLPPVIVNGKILYSFTEDSSGNGRLDRIRVQTNVELYGDFSDFDISVDEYEIDRTKGVNGFVKASDVTHKTPFDDDSFYIYIKEKPEIDGEKTPLWSVTKNTSLTNKTGSIVGNPASDKNIKPIDTIPPRIVYTLTLPGHPQTYMQVSEPVVSSSGTDITASFGGGLSVLGINNVDLACLRFIFNLSGSFKIEDLAKSIDSSNLDNGYFQTDGVDHGQKAEDLSALDPDSKSPKYPLDWSYTKYVRVSYKGDVEDETGLITTPLDILIPPNKLLTAGLTSKPRRVTDVLVSMAPENTNSKNYFAWPVWARFKKSLNAPYTGGNDVFWGQQPTDTGIIWQFDGTNFLETNYIESNEGLELQARMNDNLPGTPVLFWTTSNIPAEYRNPKEATEAKKTGGLWLPNVFTPLYNYVPLSDGINGKTADGSSSKLFIYDIAANSLNVESGAKFEFIFRLSNISDMFIARLDIPQGAAIPANWYTLIRPFVFEIQNIRRQRGGVTVLNNVINSNNREAAFIRYHLTRPGRVNVQIYTLDGTLVKSLRRNEQRGAGEWTDLWDGTNNGGRAVARGMYFVRVVGPDIDEIRKIMVVK
jgi:hypothetical protein